MMDTAWMDKAVVLDTSCVLAGKKGIRQTTNQ